MRVRVEVEDGETPPVLNNPLTSLQSLLRQIYTVNFSPFKSYLLSYSISHLKSYLIFYYKYCY